MAEPNSPVRPLRASPGSAGAVAPAPAEPFPLTRRSRRRLPFKRRLRSSTTVAAVIAATLAGLAVRLVVTRGLSLDEIRTAELARLPFGQLINHLARAGVQPPLHPVLVWFMVHLFGDGDMALRVPSLIAGVALIPAMAWLAAEVFERRSAVVSALFGAVAPALVWYSQEASRYALVALFGTLAVVAAIRVIQRGRPADWTLHVLAASAAVWSGWSGVSIVAATELALLATVMQRRRANALPSRFLTAWGVGTLALACQLLPLGLLLASQLKHGGGLAGVANVSASGISFYTTVSNVSWGLFGFHAGAVTRVLSAVWPLGMLASLVSIGRETTARGWMILAFALAPAVATFALGLAVPGAFDIRYALASVPLAFVLIARIATTWPRSQTGRILVVGAIAAVLVGALVDQQLNPNNPRRYEYRQALAEVQRDAGPSAAVLYEPGVLRPVLARDAPGLRASPLTTPLPSGAEAQSVFVIASFENSARLLALQNRAIGALRATRHLVSYRAYPGVNVWWFR